METNATGPPPDLRIDGWRCVQGCTAGRTAGMSNMRKARVRVDPGLHVSG
jgi:hypothetical protein